MKEADRREPFTRVPNWVIRDGILDPNEMAVYLVLLSYRDPYSGMAWPGLATIAEQSRMSRSTVKRTLPKLEAQRLIKITRRPKGNGDNEPNLYKVAQFSRGRPVDNSLPKGRPRFKSTSGNPPPRVKVNTPGSKLNLAPGVTLNHEKEPSTRRTNEKDVRVTLTPDREISFATYNEKASSRQVEYLSDLFIIANKTVPTEETKRFWAAFTSSKASILIGAYLAEIPRHSSYEGPVAGDVAYEALTAKGKEWADAEFVPELLAAG